MGFDWSDYVRRRDAAWPMGIFVVLSAEEVAAFRRGDNPPTYRGPTYGSHNPAFGSQKVPSGMGEQPSIINRDPGDETARPDVSQQIIAELRDHQGELSAEIVIARARIVELEAHSAHMADLFTKFAQVPFLPYPGLATYPPLGSDAQRIMALEAEVALLRADIAKLMAAAPSTAPTPPPHNPMANALAHSEPKPAWQL